MCCGILTLTDGRDFKKAEVVFTVGSFCGCGCGGANGGGERGLPMLKEIIWFITLFKTYSMLPAKAVHSFALRIVITFM